MSRQSRGRSDCGAQHPEYPVVMYTGNFGPHHNDVKGFLPCESSIFQAEMLMHMIRVNQIIGRMMLSLYVKPRFILPSRAPKNVPPYGRIVQ
jgi:hypothetical protein